MLRGLAVILALLLVGCQDGGATGGKGSADGGGGDGEEETPPVPVEVRQATRGDVFAVYSGTASLETDNEAEVVAKVGGEVIAITVEEGDAVREGQVLARLDGDRLRLEMERTEANLKKLEQEYERNVELNEQGLVSAGTFENIKYELDSLRAAHDLARLEYSYTQIRAPIDGIVSNRYIKLGNTISANDPVFQVTDMDPLRAYLFVPEREFRKLRAGQTAELLIDAIPDTVFKGEILRISPVVDPQTGTFKVTVAVSDDGGRLKPGMFGRFQIVYDAHLDALLVPRLAIVEDETEKSVFGVEDGVAKRRKIETGYSRGESVEVVAGLEGDETIVTIGQTGLKDGSAVKVINLEASDG